MATPMLSVQNKLSVTSHLFEAYLACPTKCYLQFKGEVGAGSDYTAWAAKRAESYCRNGIQELTAAHPLELGGGSLESGRWKNASWHFALDQIVRAQDWEASLKVVQRITSKETKLFSQLVPIRFVPDNKLTNSDKMVAAFEALVLAKSLGIKVGVPWNNNNAEHAIKAFARLRDVMAGASSKKGIDEYLTLLSVAETCEYQGLDFLSFLRSGETDIESFAKGRCRYTRRKNNQSELGTIPRTIRPSP